MRLNGIVGAEIPYYKMMNKAMPGPAKDAKRKPKNSTRTAHHATGGHRHTPRTARVRRYCKLSERREGAVTPNAS